MGLLNLTNLEDGFTASANIFNERFGKIADVLNGNIDAENIKNQAITAAKLAANVFGAIYPIGSVYTNATDNTNPQVLLGFGTWAEFGTGRVPVGYDAAQAEFNAAGKTGGEKAVALTANQNGSHSHGINDGGHSHGVNDPGHSHAMGRNVVFTQGSTNTTTDNRAGGYQQITWGNFSTNGSGSNISINGSGANIGIQNSGNGEAHNNLQPYVIVYMWRRVS